MKKIYTTILLLIFSIAANSQTTLTLVNSPSNDLDALVTTKTNASEGDDNFQSSPDIGCGTWTYGGAGTGINRCFLNFDWSQIPSNATIISAKLDLYSINMGWIIHGGHDGDNESWIKRVVDNWDASTVTWNNQPGASSGDAVTLTKSMSSNQDYLNIDVTTLVQNMKSTGSWNGFAFVSKDESSNGVLSFVSSNNADSAKRPQLHITFSVPTSNESVQKGRPKLLIYPNPSLNPAIHVSGFDSEARIELYSVTGRKIGDTLKMPQAGSIRVTDFTLRDDLVKGIYIVRVKSSEYELSEKIVIQ